MPGTLLHIGDTVQVSALLSAIIAFEGGGGGAVAFEAIKDSSVSSPGNWAPINAAPESGSAAPAATATIPAAANITYSGNTPGSSLFRVRATAEFTTPVTVTVTTIQSILPAGSSGGGGGGSSGAASAGGATPYHLASSAASNNATVVKNTPGTLFSIQVFNWSITSPRYLKLYDKATIPVPASDTPVKVIPVPKAVDANTPSGVVFSGTSNGVKFSNGIGFALVGGLADNDNTSIGAGDMTLNFDYA